MSDGVLACEVCGQPAATVRQSRLPLPVSVAYCQRCHKAELEPLQLVEAYLALDEHERVNHDVAYEGRRHLDEIIARSLEFLRRS